MANLLESMLYGSSAGKDPRSVGKAYSLMNEKLKKDELDETFGSNFERLQETKESGSATPFLDTDWQDNGDSDLDRWKKQIDAMIESENPVLMKEGLEQINNYRQRQFAPVTATAAMSTAGKMAVEMGLKPGTPEFNNFVESYAFKSNRQYAPKYVTPAEAKNIRWEDKERTDPLVGQNWEDIRGDVRKVDDAASMRDSAGNVIGTLKDALFNEETGIYNDDAWSGGGFKTVVKGGIAGALQDLTQNDPRYKSYSDVRAGSAAQIVRAMGEKGALSDKDIDRALALLPNISGARGMPDTRQTAELKFKYLELMLGIDPKDWAAVIDLAESEIGTLTSSTGEGGTPPAPQGYE
jgi:hypothetical protein